MLSLWNFEYYILILVMFLKWSLEGDSSLGPTSYTYIPCEFSLLNYCLLIDSCWFNYTSWTLVFSKHISISRSGKKHTNVLLRGSVFRNFSINFFTYGFPVCFFLVHIVPVVCFCRLIFVSFSESNLLISLFCHSSRNQETRWSCLS